MTRSLPLLLLLGGCGDPAVNTWRRTLDASGHLTLLKRDYPADGGSIVFRFRSGTEAEFSVRAVHQDAAMFGNAKYQEFRIRGESMPAETEIPPGSALESRLVVLLETCRLAGPPETPQTRDWLLGRLKSRDIPWGPCP